MQIELNRVVTLTYKLSNTQTGEQIEVADETNPLTFLFGVGSMLPEFERNLEGKKTGDAFTFNIDADNAYGRRDETRIAEIPKDVFFDEGGNFDENLFKIGAHVPMSDQDGRQLRGIIIDLTEENVIMDFNNPMADKDLTFEISILEVRIAEADEIAHGHVHGPNGHQH